MQQLSSVHSFFWLSYQPMCPFYRHVFYPKCSLNSFSFRAIPVFWMDSTSPSTCVILWLRSSWIHHKFCISLSFLKISSFACLMFFFQTSFSHSFYLFYHQQYIQMHLCFLFFLCFVSISITFSLSWSNWFVIVVFELMILAIASSQALNNLPCSNFCSWKFLHDVFCYSDRYLIAHFVGIHFYDVKLFTE